MNKNKDLTGLYYSKIVKSLKYLEYSYNRTLSMPLNPSQMTDAQLEAWDGFSSRFARTSDIFLSKYIRAYILKDDPAFDRGFRDQDLEKIFEKFRKFSTLLLELPKKLSNET